MKPKQKKTVRLVVQDVRATYEPSTGYIRLIAELMSGDEMLILEYPPLVKPLFANEGIESDASDYGYYYDQALEEAHKRGLYIAGEVEDENFLPI